MWASKCEHPALQPLHDYESLFLPLQVFDELSGDFMVDVTEVVDGLLKSGDQSLYFLSPSPAWLSLAPFLLTLCTSNNSKQASRESLCVCRGARHGVQWAAGPYLLHAGHGCLDGPVDLGGSRRLPRSFLKTVLCEGEAGTDCRLLQGA